ncbi:U-box domain-containing protein 33-like isoform X2 [Actinidia eriantha]|uniref:U-box domain-containing protein 33-like isoform X2 n=1 Tax=Actinidia eriantha TaxID=165200 RepID=UPI002583610D|nr:U-box domain-containing protein 33-like isoform X2 [Actinidia eriantha]
MAVVSRMPLTLQQINPITYHNFKNPRMKASRGEISEEPPVQVVEDKVYVAVGKEYGDSKSTLTWALHNSGGRKICILHVHEPAQRIPFMGTKIQASRLEEQQVKAYRETEKQDMNKLLREYGMLCKQAGVHAELVHIEMESIEKGILELISQHSIRKLVMGAAADKHYSKKMLEPKSKKAIHVRLQAPISCHIWFICRGNLVHTREGRLEGVSMEVASLIQQASPKTEIGQSNQWRSRSTNQVQNDQLTLFTPSPQHRRVRSDVRGTEASASSPDSSREGTPCSTERNFGEWDRISGRSPSLNSHFSPFSAGDMADDSALSSAERAEDGLESRATHHLKDDCQLTSPSSVLVHEGVMKDELYDKLKQAMEEVENSRREAFEESVRRRKAEKEAIDAFRRAKTAESLYADEMRQRKETEEALAKGKEELENMKQKVDEVMEELGISLEQKSSLESQIAHTEKTIQELEQKMFSAVELMQKYKTERDELQVEHDNALIVVEELRKKYSEKSSNSLMPQIFSEFSFSEIERATNNFDPALKIGEGGYGSIYKCLLRNTQVAIKMLHSHSLQGPLEFQQEVNILSKLRHPNIVTLVGACPETWTLVYEYLPNGSLEDRLSCKDNTPPLSWQTRLRIAVELCSVLIFLHNSTPHNIVVHGDLKPANILLDENYVCKLSDFGICRAISQNELSSNNTTLCCRTDPKGTFAYMDPEFHATGELTRKSDTYSFGIILLRLLTGRSAFGLPKEVQCALDKGTLKNLLDPTAGDWPFVQAKQLAHLAMRCCEMNRRRRPDLASDVWRMLEPMRVLCGASSFRLSSDERCQIPPYFICPIFQKIMQDPHVADDGFSYELEAMRRWLDSGHDTSPKTNLKLTHCNLVPNHTLRSAIQGWLHQP